MKIWRPDTCKCVIEEVYEGNTIVGGGQVLTKCTNHASVADEDLYGVLYANPDGENKVKNQVLRTLLGMGNVKGLGLEVSRKKEDGTDDVVLKDGVEYNWSFQGSGNTRKLKVSVMGASLSASQKQNIKSDCDTKFGSGKVEVV